jgi:hypothetical protein
MCVGSFLVGPSHHSALLVECSFFLWYEMGKQVTLLKTTVGWFCAPPTKLVILTCPKNQLKIHITFGNFLKPKPSSVIGTWTESRKEGFAIFFTFDEVQVWYVGIYTNFSCTQKSSKPGFVTVYDMFPCLLWLTHYPTTTNWVKSWVKSGAGTTRFFTIGFYLVF